MNEQESVFRRTYRLRHSDVDVHRRLRWDTLFTMLQEAAIDHAELLGLGRSRTLDRGLLWVITIQQLEISRLPEYDESITLETWPGRIRHVFFPRFYRLLDAQGALLAAGSAFWGLMDQQARTLVYPEKAGIFVPGAVTENELPLPRPGKSVPCTQSAQFTVPYSYLDLNGHMNNTRYFDLAQDLLPPEAQGQTPKRIIVEYASEATLGQTLNVGLGAGENGWYLEGVCDRRVFRMWID